MGRGNNVIAFIISKMKESRKSLLIYFLYVIGFACRYLFIPHVSSVLTGQKWVTGPLVME